MRLENPLSWPVPLLILLLPACDKSSTPTETAANESRAEFQAKALASNEATAASTPFEAAQLWFEFNTGEHDMGLQLFLDHEPWRNVTVTAPNGTQLFGVQAQGQLRQVGLTELRFEGAEPEFPDVFGRFPEGQYTFRGQTVEGASLFSQVRLSHRLPAKPTFTPRNGQVVNPRSIAVRWNAPGAKQVEVIVENEELGDVLDITISAGPTNSLTIPPQFLRRGKEYLIEVLSIADNGNRTIAQSTFRTAS
jgi:hypothetical protein